jgi:DNA-binding LacI/PurR family transcriptional regulator
VSRAAGVSVATVSNVLNAPERVAADTRQRVAAAIERLEYRPNRAARSLPQGRTFTIGYCIPDGKERFALDTFLHQLTERASESAMDILLFTPHRGQSEADSYREIVRRGAVDGFIVSSTVHDDERVQVLLDAAIPVVSFGRTDLSDFHSWVDVDGRAGTRAATEHLIGQGHQRLALVAWPEGSITGDERAAGFHEGLEEAGLEIDSRYVIRVENELEAGREAAARLFDLHPAPTAIVTVQDVLAAGVAAELNARGIRGGNDVAVTGFDDSPPAIYSTPSITSVRQPIEAIGRRVVEFLMHDLEGSEGIPLSALVEPELVVRDSSTGWERP